MPTPIKGLQERIVSKEKSKESKESKESEPPHA
jgi:hypothetical protein